jgi:mono/diheme cytochrome c family protein
MRRVLAAIAVLSAGVAVSAAAAPPAPYAREDSANRGLYVALRVCAACHAVGPLGEGPDGEAPRFATIGRRHDAASLRRRLGEISVSGHQDMPPIPLTAREIEDVATYIQSVAAAPAAKPATRPRSRREVAA